MSISPLAGKKAPRELLIDVEALEREYYENRPDPGDPRTLVSFGTSGHRGHTHDRTFTEAHVLAVTQAVCDYRKARGISGPLFLGKDTHALSAPAQRTAIEVLAANGVVTRVQHGDGFTPTPVISWAILTHNRRDRRSVSDGIVITPSHNPPSDGGIKYNPPTAGPADTETTAWIQERANELLKGGGRGVKRLPYEEAVKSDVICAHDYMAPYVADLPAVIDMDAVRTSGIQIGVDPLGGASAVYWSPIAEIYGLDLTVVNPVIDPAFSFMMVDHDGKIRMDCSSPWAMAGLVRLKDSYRVAFGNDPDVDRHGIVTPSAGLMNPNHYLAVAIRYLLTHRPGWPPGAAVGKTLVSSSMIDRVVGRLGRRLCEVPVGFKYLAPGLFDGAFCFGGEESAGASFLRRDGTVWATDKDGIIMGLLAAEITAVTGRDPGEHYAELTAEFGAHYYTRIDAPATPAEKKGLKALSPDDVQATEMAGDEVVERLTRAPGNGEPIGGLKVVSEGGWFAARPSGTEDIYKIYAESFRSEEHLGRIVAEARGIVSRALRRPPGR
jgi:phosphoglucomutase